MTYVAGTLTEDNASLEMANVVQAALLLEGYTLEDTIVSGTYTYKVFKMDAANNALGYTWFFAMYYQTAGAGQVGFLPMEDWDATTNKQLRRVASGGTYAYSLETTYWSPTMWGATPQDVDYNKGNAGYYGELQPIPEQVTGDTDTAGRGFATPTSSFGYWVSVTPERVAVLSSSRPGSVFVFGLYEPDPELIERRSANILPIFSSQFRSNAQTIVVENGKGNAFTRYPGASDNATYYQKVIAVVDTVAQNIPAYPTTGKGSTNPDGRKIVFTSRGEDIDGGGVFGRIPDLLVFRTSLATVTRGDTIDIDGDTYVVPTAVQWGLVICIPTEV